jgi:hypothetical protein
MELIVPALHVEVCVISGDLLEIVVSLCSMGSGLIEVLISKYCFDCGVIVDGFIVYIV